MNRGYINSHSSCSKPSGASRPRSRTPSCVWLPPASSIAPRAISRSSRRLRFPPRPLRLGEGCLGRRTRRLPKGLTTSVIVRVSSAGVAPIGASRPRSLPNLNSAAATAAAVLDSGTKPAQLAGRFRKATLCSRNPSSEEHSSGDVQHKGSLAFEVSASLPLLQGRGFFP